MGGKPNPSRGPALPDRAAMDAYVADRTPGDRDRGVAAAQEMMYDAWGRKTPRARQAVAIKAIDVCPICADAYNLLADHAANDEAAADLYRLAVRAGELALGPEGFKDYDGEFWGFLETRPYMRARHGLALALLNLGEDDAAIAHFRAMLDLNPGDNQGIRYLLLAQLIRRDDTKGAKVLLASYADEWSVHWLYTRLLLGYREGRKTSKTTQGLLKEAFEVNAHVPAILASDKPLKASKKDFLLAGGPDEAIDYVVEFGAAWKKTEGAVGWLVASLKTDGG